MRILTRYVLREFLVPLAYCLIGFVSIYVLFELFGSFSRMLEAKMPFVTIVKYFCGYLSPYVEYLAPAALMLATLYTMWSFCRHSEIVAMRANGVSFLAIAMPLLSVAFLMGCFVVWVNECYVPSHAQWAKRLRSERFDSTSVGKSDDIVYRNAQANRTWSIDSAEDAECTRLVNVRVSEDRPDGTRLFTLTAPRAQCLDGEWWFYNPQIRHYDESGAEVASANPALDAMPMRVFPEFGETPSDFIAQNRDWQYNSISDRFRYLRTHTELSERLRRKYGYDLWSQIAAPLACLVITLFAIPAGIASGRQSVFAGIVRALAMFFGYYAVVIGCMVAADCGWLPAILAAFLPSAVFLSVGIVTFYRCR